MIKFDNWDSVVGTVERRDRLPAGGHQCKIVGVEVKTGRTGALALFIRLDIDEGGPYDGMGMEAYQRRGGDAGGAYYPYTLYVRAYGQGFEPSAYLKGIVELVERCNVPYKWDGDEAQLVGKRIGALFRDKEIASRNGGTFWASEVCGVCALEDAPSAPVPEPNRLYRPWTPQSDTNGAVDGALGAVPPPMTPPAGEDDLPF